MFDAVGKEAYVIPVSYTAGRRVFIPYLFTDEELKAIFHEIDIYEASYPFEPILLSTYFRLTYTCGLRPNEGRNLKRNEVDLNSGEIRVVNTKWHKSRNPDMKTDVHYAFAVTQKEKGDLDSMQITDVRVRKVAKEGKLKAVVSITIDDEFVVHDIKVIEGEKGLFIAMPSKKSLDGEYRDIAHPINSNTRERIQTTILGRYKEALEEEPEMVIEEM